MIVWHIAQALLNERDYGKPVNEGALERAVRARYAEQMPNDQALDGPALRAGLAYAIDDHNAPVGLEGI